MKYILYLSLILFFVSCKQENKNLKKTIQKKPYYTSYSGKESSWDLYFPDTIVLNRKYKGRIVYKGILDTITTSFEDEHSRYIKVVLMTSDKLNGHLETLRKMAKDTFGAINYREIPFYDISFKKPGVNYIQGYIIDQVFLEAKGTKPKDSLVRMIEKQVTVNCKVFVKKE
ncbi:hypothetical protein QWY90_03320 [Flavobacterium paronense]|uniref:Gliding motility lipoprotein GldH n=1 Tax=Flavobacterium paronense TaxID=1392775 RepID=A0ABV5GBD2_9FLAO|nr:hypothetical protein [Flavobacterium paronense]MDN3676338.1 hypothetical protein [Flavobacterium paronense]